MTKKIQCQSKGAKPCSVRVKVVKSGMPERGGIRNILTRSKALVI